MQSFLLMRRICMARRWVLMVSMKALQTAYSTGYSYAAAAAAAAAAFLFQ